LAREVGFASVFRWLARLSPLALGLGYALCVSVATGFYYFGRLQRRPLLESIGALCALVAISCLFTIVTWYQDDEVVRGAFFLGITTAVSKVIAFNLALVVVARESSGNTLFALGSLFGIPLGILVWTLVFAVLISLGRRCRRFVGPDSGRNAAVKR